MALSTLRSVVWALLSVAPSLLWGACAPGYDAGSRATPTSAEQLSSNVEYIAWETGLAQLDDSTVAWIEGFAASVPAKIPTNALPQVHFLASMTEGSSMRELAAVDHVVPQSADGVIHARFVLGNPSGQQSSRSESVLCLLNHVQVPCRPDARTWNLAPPARTMVFLPLEIPAEIGDRIDLVLMPSEQPGYPFPLSLVFPTFVGHRDLRLEGDLQIPGLERIWPFEGCGLAKVLREAPPLDDGHRLPVNVGREESLSLLIESCQAGERVRLLRLEIAPL
jgi:hypothetical protein